MQGLKGLRNGSRISGIAAGVDPRAGHDGPVRPPSQGLATPFI
jgi:hypothetical protein